MNITMLTVEELCKKLRPIFGKKIDLIYLKYTVADSLETRREIEMMLNVLYQKHINDNVLNEKVLLEPPAEELIGGEYPLGKVIYADSEICTFGLREQDWPRHVCVSGMSGSGKTNFAYVVLGNFILQKKPFIVFDWKKSFRPLLLADDKIILITVGNERVANMFKTNINKPPKGVNPREWINLLCDLINDAFFASFGVHKLLTEALDESFKEFGVYEGSENYPTWLYVKEKLIAKEEVLRGREAEWLASAVRIAHALTFGAFGEALNSNDRDVLTVDDLLDKSVIFELDSLNNAEKKFFCQFMLTFVYKLKKYNRKSEDFKHAILVDEAHNIFLKDRPSFTKEGITDMIYREIREYGTALICLDQHISKLSDVVAGNSACNVAFQQVLPADVECVSSIMQLKDHRNFFSMLPVGQAIVRLAERHYKPFQIQVPAVKMKLKEVSDEFVAERTRELVKQCKRVKLFENSCNEYELKKRMEKLDGLFKHTCVEPNEEFLKRQIEAEQKIESKPVEFKKPDWLKEHDKIQKEKAKIFGQNRESQLSQLSHSIKLNNTQKQALQTIKENSNLEISKIYKLLSLSARKGNELKKQFIEQGLVDVEEERNASGWKKFLRPTSMALNLLS